MITTNNPTLMTKYLKNHVNSHYLDLHTHRTFRSFFFFLSLNTLILLLLLS